ncbi:DUF1203 domain-containing protein [Phenylobacterium sp.]|uniref:DUF1203 domain-containing protein n=1 Tax=Phenylobacterium sp. TaxID=1871053 RepID=UPI0025ECC476|nr:DUF1203 domain-containing protein [Phenylobacterium sp.]
MSFVVTGLPIAPFQPLFALSDAALAERRIVRRTVDAPLGFPCRVTLEDAPVGETVLLLNYEHQPADTPFRARHAIYVREGDHPTRRDVDAIPPALAVRPHISLRAFTSEGMMVAAEVAPGSDLPPAIDRMLARPDVAYLHAHYAGMGCYAARIDRA